MYGCLFSGQNQWRDKACNKFIKEEFNEDIGTWVHWGSRNPFAKVAQEVWASVRSQSLQGLTSLGLQINLDTPKSKDPKWVKKKEVKVYLDRGIQISRYFVSYTEKAEREYYDIVHLSKDPQIVCGRNKVFDGAKLLMESFNYLPQAVQELQRAIPKQLLAELQKQLLLQCLPSANSTSLADCDIGRSFPNNSDLNQLSMSCHSTAIDTGDSVGHSSNSSKGSPNNSDFNQSSMSYGSIATDTGDSVGHSSNSSEGSPYNSDLNQLSTIYGSNITAGSGSNGNGGDVNVASRTFINDASGAFTIDASPPSNETEEYAGQKSSFDNIAASEAEEEVNQRDDTNGSSLIPSGSSKQPVVTFYTVSPQAKRKVSKGKEKDDNSGAQRKKPRKSGEKNDRASAESEQRSIVGGDDESTEVHSQVDKDDSAEEEARASYQLVRILSEMPEPVPNCHYFNECRKKAESEWKLVGDEERSWYYCPECQKE
jgi:hypothetical protein